MYMYKETLQNREYLSIRQAHLMSLEISMEMWVVCNQRWKLNISLHVLGYCDTQADDLHELFESLGGIFSENFKKQQFIFTGDYVDRFA